MKDNAKRNKGKLQKYLVQRYMSGQKDPLKEQKFLRLCAYWALKDGFDGLIPTPFPGKPLELVQYEALPYKEKQAVKPEFWLGLKDHLVEHERVLNFNRDNYRWLKDIKSRIPEADTDNHQRLDARIEEYQRWFLRHGLMKEKPKINTKDLDAVVQMFNGEVLDAS